MYPSGWEKQKSMKVNYTTSKKTLEKNLQQNNGLWDRLLLQNGPWGSPRQVLEPPRQPPGSPPGSPKTSPGSHCDSCLAPPGPPCESLGAP